MLIVQFLRWVLNRYWISYKEYNKSRYAWRNSVSFFVQWVCFWFNFCWMKLYLNKNDSHWRDECLLLHTLSSYVIFFRNGIDGYMPIPVAERFKERVYCRSLAGIAGSNRAAGMDVCLLWLCVLPGKVSETGWSLAQKSPTDCGVSLCVI